MKVTDLDYHMDDAILEKMDLLIKRFSRKHPKLDSFLLFDGYEGYGKTTLSLQCAYYAAYKTGKEFSVDNVFFDVDELLKFAKEHENQIIIWDEAALAGMASDWHKKSQKKFIKFLMVARKKRHFYLMNIPHFRTLKRYLAIDRSLGLVHVYAQNETKLGYFTYYTRKHKEKLYDLLKRGNNNAYRTVRYRRGRFRSLPEGIIDEEKYDKKKDKAIDDIGVDEQMSAKEKKLRMLQYEFYNAIDRSPITITDFCKKHTHFSKQAVTNWKHNPEKYKHVEYRPKKMENKG